MCQFSFNSYMKNLLSLLLIGHVTNYVKFVSCEDVTLTVLHTNDVHSRFLQTNKYGGSCTEQEESKQECYGGFARLHWKVKEIRASHKNVLYLSGGDYYQGTVWYTFHKWKVVSKFVNVLNHTAMAFGNHEFDDNIQGLIPFLDAATFPLISCNIDDSHEPDIQGKYKKSVVVTVEGGRKVGIIGYTTEETSAISNPGNLIFKDVVKSIKEESEKLYSQGVKILIAVGHAGYDVDQKIAKEVPLIDAVVGGHTNTFLYHGTPPDIEVHLGDYPTLINQPGGRKVPVVQAYAFGKYLGYLNLTVNDDGEVTSWGGNPILMDHNVPQDEPLLKEIQDWGKDIHRLGKVEIGKTRVFLNGSVDECRLRECNLGNLITDAMVHMNLKFADDVFWSDVTMAIHNGGGVRGSIDERSKNGSISMDDVLTILPFQNTVDLVEITGENLRKAFEFAVEDYDPRGFHLAGKFLQVSGMRVVYDVHKPNGQRIKSIKVRCKACRVPHFVPLDDKAVYKVAVPTYVATGGDGFKIIKRSAIVHHLSGILDSDMIVEYIKTRSPIITGVEDRIMFENSECDESSGAWTNPSFFSLTSLLIIVLSFNS